MLLWKQKQRNNKGKNQRAISGFFSLELNAAIGLFAALIVTLRFKYTISVTDAFGNQVQVTIGSLLHCGVGYHSFFFYTDI
jgi:hypothetical protein